MVTIITLSVLGRTFFNTPFAWTVEFSEYIMLYMTFFTLAWILRQAAHVKIDMVVNLFNSRVRKVINLISSGCCLLASIFLTYFSFIVSLDYIQRGDIMYRLVPLPEYILYLPIFVGSALLTFRLIAQILNYTLYDEQEIY
ncbi:TRAP transporter small permease [Salicibibacter cibarius]